MKKSKPLAIILTLTGLLLIMVAAYFVVSNYIDSIKATRLSKEIETKLSTQLPQNESGDIPDYILHPDKDMPEMVIDGDKYIGILSIPSLELRLPVMSGWNYRNLNIAPCRYAGSAYLPGFAIAAHNFDGHFGRIKTLKDGDTIEFEDADGNIIKYEVSNVDIIEPTDIQNVVDIAWDMTLFTCTIGGKSRVVVHCTKLKEENGLA